MAFNGGLLTTPYRVKEHTIKQQLDVGIAQRCATLHVPDPRPDYNAMIAATALEHGLTVVTRNIEDFEKTGVKLLNPWL